MNKQASAKPRRGNTLWAMVLSWLSGTLLTLLALCLVLLTTLCSASFMKAQVNRSDFSEAAYSYLYDNFTSYGAASGFSADVMTAALSREQITADMEQSVTWLYEGDTAIDSRNEILNTTYDNMISDLNNRGIEVTSDIEGAVVVVADACRQDYANYVTVPLASQLYTFIEKLNRVVPIAVCVMAVLCAVSLFLTIRLAGTSKFGVRCLTFAFTAATVLCIIGATALFPAMHLNNLNISPASVKQLIITYVGSLFGRFGLFALIYGAVAVILLALTFTAGSRTKRRQHT
ncbi:hypothetical protein [Gemmiger sp.]